MWCIAVPRRATCDDPGVSDTGPTEEKGARRWQTARRVPVWALIVLVVAVFLAWMARDGRAAYATADQLKAEGTALTATGSHVFLEKWSGRTGSDLVGTQVRVTLPGLAQPVRLEWVRDRTTESSPPADFRTGWFPAHGDTGYLAPLTVHVLTRSDGTVIAMADEDMAVALEDPEADNFVLAAALSLAALVVGYLLLRAWLIARAKGHVEGDVAT